MLHHGHQNASLEDKIASSINYTLSIIHYYYYSYHYYYYYFLNPRKTRVRKKIEKVKKNGEANVPSGRPTQNYCATKQN